MGKGQKCELEENNFKRMAGKSNRTHERLEWMRKYWATQQGQCRARRWGEENEQGMAGRSIQNEVYMTIV